jgi:surface polysaccharide O-acyltransferase-like enzyme
MISRTTADAARVMSMGAVLAIHATQNAGVGLVADHDWASSAGAATLLNQVCRFCVPLFILLSGFALAARERGVARKAGLAEPRVSAWGFWGDRLAKIALPFVVWTLIYRLCDAPWAAGAGTALGWVARNLPLDLLSGGAQYHLYFIAIIVQCYVLFPWLLRVRSVWWTVGFAALALLYTAPAHSLLAACGLTRPELPSWAFPAWLVWFQVGVRAGLAVEAAEAGSGRRLLTLVAVLLTAAGLCAEWWWQSYRMADPGWFGHFHRWTVLLYVAACWVALVAWNAPIRRWLEPAPRTAVLAWLTGVSFLVYLGHPLVLRLVERLGIADPFLALAALCAGTLAIVAVLQRILRPVPALGRAIGL